MDILHTLQLALEQLQRARRENEILRARVDSFHLAGQFLMARPVEQGAGHEVDAAHYLQKLIHEEQAKRMPQQPKSTATLKAEQVDHAAWPEHEVERDD